MNKTLKITNIVLSCCTLISIIFAVLLFKLNQQETFPNWLQLTYGSLLAITGMGVYLALLIVGSIMIHLYRTKKCLNRLVLINAILNIVYGVGYVICTAISHATGTWAEIFTIVMDVLSLGLIGLSSLIYQKDLVAINDEKLEENLD